MITFDRRIIYNIIIASCVVFPVLWTGIAPASAVDASGTATIQCGAFTGDPRNQPGWVSSVPYSIEGDRISISTNVRDETNEWSGAVNRSGHILLTGKGSGGDGAAWVMHFTGAWRGTGGTRLTGGYRNVVGLLGHRSCNITL